MKINPISRSYSSAASGMKFGHNDPLNEKVPFVNNVSKIPKDYEGRLIWKYGPNNKYFPTGETWEDIRRAKQEIFLDGKIQPWHMLMILTGLEHATYR